MQDPTRSLHKTQSKFQRLLGIHEILVIGSIFSTQPMLTSGIQRAQLTWAQSFPDFVAFMAPPLLGHSSHLGVIFREQVRQNHFPEGIDVIP